MDTFVLDIQYIRNLQYGILKFITSYITTSNYMHGIFIVFDLQDIGDIIMWYPQIPSLLQQHQTIKGISICFVFTFAAYKIAVLDCWKGPWWYNDRYTLTQ